MCTSFASYYGNPIYGMNFDFPDVEMKLKIVKTEITKYICFYLNAYGVYYPFAGMNLKGKFVNFQEMYKLDNEASERSGVEIDAIELFFSYLSDQISVDEVGLIKDDVMIRYPENFKVHSMFADTSGKAVILESIKGKAVHSKINEKKIVMTNFSNFINSDSEKIDQSCCVGADRYLTAYSMVGAEKSSLDIDKAIKILCNTFQKEGDYQTRCSVVFDPLKSEVYMIIARNFNNIWRISLENETLEKVCDCNKKIEINNEGMIINKLW
jgi:hypothetical protein